ncbi:bromodomain adjacent to zinc finger domain protein 1A [Rhinophrynus dorsalis]
MPLLHRKPFNRQPPPPGLLPTERLFYCRVTNEVFRDYDEFFERTILCNSLVWSCSLTGKSGLTYPEALESEKKVRKSLQDFPESLIVPVLYLSTFSSHQRATDLCQDIFAYVKDRFFVGETVNVVRNNGARLECKVLEVKVPPQENGMANGHSVHDEDTIVISDSDDDEPIIVEPKNSKKEPTHPSLLKYKVKPIQQELYESVTVKASQLSRNPTLFSQDRLKLFLKLHCEPRDGMIKLKANSAAKYQISVKSFLQYFPEEPPDFHRPPPPNKRPSVGRSSTNKPINRVSGIPDRHIQAERERERIMKQKREHMQAMEMERLRMRREQEEMARLREKYHREMQREQLKKIVEVERIKKKEEREKIKIEKEREREKLREEKKKYAERLKMWSKRRDDMECDDLKDLPVPTPVKTRLPPECFGDAIMVLEFLHAFGELFDLKDEFPEGMSYEMLEEALVGNDPEGPLCELLFFFMSAIFQAISEEEEEVAKDEITGDKDLTEAFDEDNDPTQTALTAVASLAAAWPQLHQGCSLKDLNLDSCTLSEILRLHILASGADATFANAKYRYQKQGGFDATDDACVELRLNHPAIVKKLSTTSVYALQPDEKLKILHALCGKLLTLVSTRDFIEDYNEELRQAKQELRELKAEQNRRDREEAAARIRKRREDKLREQERKMKDKQERLKYFENQGIAKDAGDQENLNAEQRDLDTASEDDDEDVTPNGKKGKAAAEDEETWRQEQLKREQELVQKIQEAIACTNIYPLGRDRWYRRFWTFFSVPGLFVEEDYSNITEDMLQPRPFSKQETPHKTVMNCHESPKSPVQENKIEPELPKPVNKPNRWCFYNSSEQLDELIEALNTRGLREHTLREALVQERNKICEKLSNLPTDRFHIADNSSLPAQDVKPGRGRSLNMSDTVHASPEKQLELRLCDLILDIEERIYQGTLGAIKVPDRWAWRTAIGNHSYELSSDETKENGTMKSVNYETEEMEIDTKPSNKDRLQGLKNETPSATSTNANTPQPVNNCIQYLARALLQIEQGVERRYLKAPLGDAEDHKRDSKSEKKRREDRKKKEEDQTSEKDDASDSGRVQRTVLDRWRESLLSSGSLSQIFLHLSTLDRSILWSRSILNARCKVCRKKGDGESMLLCDGCDRGHHIYCVRPKLKYIPEGDWFCPECKPRQRSKRMPSRQRLSVDSDMEEEEEMTNEEEEEEEDEEQRESENEEEEQIVKSEEESTPKKGRAKVQLPMKTKGKPGPKKGAGRTPKSQKGTPKNLTGPKDGSRSAGKKAHSAPALDSKPTSRLATQNIQVNAFSHEASPIELISPQVKGRGRGRGRGKMQKSVDNTPESSPFSLRPFSLDISERPLPGRRSLPQGLLTVQPESKGRGKKRLSADISSLDQGSRRSSGRHQGVHEISACEQLVVELVRHEDSWPFMRLVSKIQVPDYFDIIQRPIALNLIREKVNNCEYKSASEFIEDIELMFSNCFEYNSIDSNEAKAGIRLQSFFINEAQKLGLDVSSNKAVDMPVASKRSRL